MAAAQRKRRPAAHAGGAEVLYGYHPVAEALAAGRRTIERVLVDRPQPSVRQQGIVDLAGRRGIPWVVSTPDQLQAACGSDGHQGLAAVVSPLPEEALSAVVPAGDDATRDCLLVLLDSIVDPNNLGAIVRTAHCVGADALVIPKDRAAGATPAVSKASAGALEHTRLCRVTNLASSIAWLKQQNVWVAGLSMAAEQTLFEADLRGRLALVVGSEEKGLRPLVEKQCDFRVAIPLRGRIDSLNASAAAAVVLYEAFRQRQLPGGT